MTYLYYAKGVFAAFATACMTSFVLGTREKPRSIPYKVVSALLLAQLGVDRRFQGCGLGSELVADFNQFARELSASVGCRYVILDAQPDLVPWYEKQGFATNQAMQRQRIDAWTAENRDMATLSVSMRLDLRAPRRARAA
ncbi:GNAT family N-acetyltransferase [Longimicrobium sp.]|uniref:GNAT family N-acetyltransferase n=1 Tax=Longimicrobium sp. TaxID=2029185 RepID=UPI002E322707|nr:GNAT family N-acetyltransferase [Longimicrobium sp.]HEX6041198.1 GNAT family N-acetyltransferase [Longimicrobium sp.]